MAAPPPDDRTIAQPPTAQPAPPDAPPTFTSVPTEPTLPAPPTAPPSASVSERTVIMPSGASNATARTPAGPPVPATDDRTLQQTADTRPATVTGRPTAAVPGYELLGELGRGGMGVVYKARHLKLNRLVALKMVLSGEFARAIDLERFRSEALRLAKVQHPNIVHIYDVGEYAGRPYFAFEFVAGELGAQKTVIAGGRYDGLIEEMGGPATPGIGWRYPHWTQTLALVSATGSSVGCSGIGRITRWIR